MAESVRCVRSRGGCLAIRAATRLGSAPQAQVERRAPAAGSIAIAPVCGGAVGVPERGKSAWLAVIFHPLGPGGDRRGKPRQTARIFHANETKPGVQDHARRWDRAGDLQLAPAPLGSEMDADVKGRLRLLWLLLVGQGWCGCWGLATGAMPTTTVTLRCAGQNRRTVSGR